MTHKGSHSTALVLRSVFLFTFLFLVLSLATLSQENKENVSDSSDPATSMSDFDSAVKIKEIQVEGNKLVPTKVILESMKTKKGSRFSRRGIAYDLKALDGLGYFEKDKLLAIPIPSGNEGVLLKIKVVENIPVSGLIIKGNESIDKSQIEEFLTPLVGMPRSIPQIRKAVEKIEGTYHDKGYLLASISELHFDPDGYITVSIDEGIIGKVEYKNNTKTKTEYLDKITPKSIQPGKPYNEEIVALYLQGLNKMGFFKEVKREIKPMEEDPSKHVLVFDINDVGVRTKSVSFGTGVGTLNGLFGNVSLTEPNFRGQGESITVSGMGGTGVLATFDGDTDGRYARQGDFQFLVSYDDPFFLGKDIGFSANTKATRTGSYLIDSAMERSIGGGFSFSKKLKKDSNWSFRSGVDVTQNTITNWGTAAEESLIEAMMEKEGKTLAKAEKETKDIRDKQLADGYYLDLSQSLVYRKLDETGTGWKNTFFATPSLAMGDINSYLGVGFDVRRYDRLTEKGTFFKNATRAEGLLGEPAYFRNLRAAGPYGARGYRQFLDVGVGQYLLSNTAELSIPLPELKKGPIKNSKIVLFNDLAFVGGESRLNSLLDREPIIASFGIGLELVVPMLGPMRIDYGIPIIRPDNKSFWSGRIHINPGSQL